MPRRLPKLLSPGSRDGTSQRARRLAALDPAHAPIDGRTSAEVIAFVQAYAEQLRFFEADGETGAVRGEGTWADFVRRPDVTVADIAAYLADPARPAGAPARWLGRPHFALLLAFVELLGHARDHLNGFTRRHLDHYYRELLQMTLEAPVADRATAIFSLRPGAAEARLPAGTELAAGRDAGGAPRIYVTERELVVTRAAVAEVRAVFVDRRVTGIADVRADRGLTAAEALEGMLRIALGAPRPGDPVPRWEGQPIDVGFLRRAREVLDFAGPALHLEHHELRALLRLVRRRRDADAEWAELNRLLGVSSPADPRDFQANLTARVGALDFAADGLPQVGSVDDLYLHRAEPDVRAYIEARLAVLGFAGFVRLMQIKLRIDADWAQINRLLERAGRRRRGLLEWSLPAGDPTDFAGNLARALDGEVPPEWPWGAEGIEAYEALLRRLEAHLGMPVERLATLVAFAEQIDGDPDGARHDFAEVDRVLAGAHAERVRAARRAQLADARGGLEGAAGFDAVASFVLGEQPPIPWDQARPALAAHLDRTQLDLLDRFRAGLRSPSLSDFDWPDAERLFELAWRRAEGLPEPIAQRVEVHNLHAFEDATQIKDDPEAPGWKPFGRRPEPGDPRARGATLGWALRSPLLSLAAGRRTLTLTLGLRGEAFDAAAQARLLAALGLGAGDTSGAPLAAALRAALAIEVTTAKGWIELELEAARLATGVAGDEYGAVIGAPRRPGTPRPALQLRIAAGADRDPLAPLPAEPERWPALRLSLRPRRGDAAAAWRLPIEPFEPLVLAAVHLKVKVEGLTGLRLQQEDRRLDPRKPFEPFGARPAVGARLYLEHPELTRARLDALRFDVEWMGLPARALADHYLNYPGLTAGGDVFKARVVLVDRNLELPLGERALFEDQGGQTRPTQALVIEDVPAAIQRGAPGAVYTSRSDLAPAGDVRLASRHLFWELTPVDFGHGAHAALAAAKARELAVAIAGGRAGDRPDAASYRVDPPYTPTIKRLAVAYAASIEIDPAAAPAAAEHQLLHVHPFGTCPIDAERPGLLPRYDTGGELYIGIRDLRPPQHLALLLQLAEGTSDPDLPPAPVTWSYLDGDRFADLSGTGIVHDATDGLIHSGIVELALPPAAPGGRLPPELYWLRVAIPRDPRSVCDAVAIRAQAVPVRFDDRGNAAAHYEQPLPAGSIERLLEPVAGVAKVEQPYSSSGGRPAEQPERFDTRVSERLRHKGRALRAWDYERLVLHRFPQIYKARCLPGGGGGVDVVVIPDVRALSPRNPFAPRAPANLLAAIRAYLVERAPAAARVRVRNARYVAVQVRLGVRFRAGVDEGFARRRLNEELIRFLSPWAFDEGAELTLGGRIYASSILDFADRRDYVDYVAELKLFRSVNGTDFALVPPAPPAAEGYHVATEGPDQVLVAAPRHFFDVIPETGFQQASFTGIDHARIELDFIVG